MPAAPELGYIAREIRRAEVLHELDAEQLGRTDSDIGIAGEIAVDLESKQDSREQQCAGAMRREIEEDGIDIAAAVVGHNDLLEQAPEDQAHAVCGLGSRESALTLELRQEIGSSFDRARHQLWEEAQESRESYKIAGGLDMLAIDIDAIRESLESVETDAYGQNQVQQEEVGLDAEKPSELVGEEVVVLIHRKNREIDHNIGPHDSFLAARRRGPLDAETAEEREDSGDGNQNEETPRPPAVEDIAGQDNEEVLPEKLARRGAQHIAKNEPIEQKDNWQENGICERIE